MMKKVIYIFLVILATPMMALSQAEVPLRSDPGNDQFTRINNFFKAAVATTDRRTSEQYYGRCIPLIRTYLRKFPNHKNAQPALYYLGESYYKIGEVNKANQAFSQLIQKYQTGTYVAGAGYRVARSLYSASKFEQAAAYFALVARNSGDQSDRTRAVYFQAQSLTRAGKLKEALPHYKTVSEESEGANPYKQAAAITYAKLLLQSDLYKEALAVCEKLLIPSQQEEVKEEAAYYAGVASSNLKDQKQAITYYRMSLNSNSQKLKGRAQTGVMGVLYAQKDYDAVIAESRKGKYKLEPEYQAKQGLMLGNANYVKKNYTTAIGYYLDVEKHDKGSNTAFEAGYKKLLCFYNIKDRQLAEKVDRFLQNYAVGRGKHKYIHQAFLMKGETLYGQEQFKDAAAAYAAIKMELIDAKYHESLMFKRGASLSKVENHAGAANAFTAFIDKFPESKSILSAYLIRASAYVNLGDKPKALRDYDHVIKAAPKTKNASISLQRSGQLQWINKKYEDSASRFEQLVKDYPKLSNKVRANAFYMVGRGRFKSKKYRDGLTKFNESLKLDPITYSKQIAMYRVIGYFTVRELKGTTESLKHAESIGLQKKIPLNVYRWLGGEYYNNEEYKKATSYLRKGVERGKPESTPLLIWRVLSKAQYKAGLYQDAFLTVSILLEMEEDKAKKVDALLDKAKIEVALGKTGDSKKTAEEALAMNPTGKTQAELLKVIGDFYYLIGEPKEAANRYVLLVDSAEELEFHALVIDRLARCLAQIGDTDESELYEQKLKKRYPRYTREKF